MTARGRGRPRRTQDQTDADRQTVIAAANRLFAAEGYDGVSMRRIATSAGCSTATLYTLFPNKRQLLHFIWEGVFSDLFDRLETIREQTDPPQQLRSLCLAYMDFWLERPDDYRAIFLIEDRPQAGQEDYFVDSSSALSRMHLFADAVAQAQQRGDLRAGDPLRIQSVLLCAMQGYALNLITIPEFSWGEPAALKQDLVDSLLAGLR